MPGLPASSKGGGMCVAPPMPYKMPPPPPGLIAPLPNMGQMATAVKTSTKVKLSAMPAVIETSEIPMSQGDEAGMLGGMVSGVNMQKDVIKKGSSKVLIEGKGCAYLTCMTTHNGANANMPAGNQVSPSQVKVQVMP